MYLKEAGGPGAGCKLAHGLQGPDRRALRAAGVRAPCCALEDYRRFAAHTRFLGPIGRVSCAAHLRAQLLVWGCA